MNPFKPEIKVKSVLSLHHEDLPTIHILHGIHNDDPLSGPGNWAKYFAELGFPVKIWDYGYVYAVTARFFVNPYVVDKLINEVNNNDILVGHSNGGAIIAAATEKGLQAGGVVLLNPALNVKRRIPCDIPWVHVYCNKGDVAVTMGKWWRRIDPVSWLIRHPYGEQGKYGPSFKDSRYKVFRGEKPPEGLSIVDGHSHINEPESLKTWGPFGVSAVMAELS